jgi:6-phosphogluconolactonase
MRIIVAENPDAVAASVAALVTGELAVPGPATLGLSGGSTPAATYRELATADLDWDRITLWLGDERWVPPGHEASNAAMVHNTLGDAASRSLMIPNHALGDPAKAAAAYEAALREAFAATGDVPGTVLLGLGEDGHTASLFPGSAALSVEDRWYVANQVTADIGWRLTATLPLLAAARHVVFVVTGEAKARVVAEILDWAVAYPARRVADRAGTVTWVLDAAAASRLKGPPS